MSKQILYFFLIFLPLSILAKPAHRIISLAPNITEIAFAVGAGKYIIGTSSATDYPKIAKEIPVVATFSDLDIEHIIQLHPDLVIAWKGGNPLEQIQRLKALHIPVYIASFKTILDIPRVGLKIGQLAGTNTQAKQFADQFRQHEEQIKNTWRHSPPVSVFYQLSLHPLLTLNDHASAGQIIKLCGGKNIFGNTKTIAPQISIENVLERNPDIILISSENTNPQSLSLILKFWGHFPLLNAVKNRAIYLVDASLAERFGPRILNGAEQICRLIRKR